MSGKKDEVPSDLLVELSAEIEDTRNTPQEESHTRAIREIAGALEIPAEEVEQAVTILDGQPTVTRELFMRRIAQTWLEGQRKAYRNHKVG